MHCSISYHTPHIRVKAGQFTLELAIVGHVSNPDRPKKLECRANHFPVSPMLDMSLYTLFSVYQV